MRKTPPTSPPGKPAARAGQPKAADGRAPGAGRSTPGAAAPPPYRPQPAPRVLQTKAAVVQPPPRAAAQAPRTPAAPPVYRPQPRKIIQPKSALPAPPTPKAPPAYRPQPTPRVLQTKPAAARQQTHPAPPRPPCQNPAALQPKAARPPAPPSPRRSVIQPILKVSGDKFESGTELRHWDGYKKLKRRVRDDYHNWNRIMQVLRAWARDVDKHKYADWDEAVGDAVAELRNQTKKRKKHSPEPTSPLRVEENELYLRLKGWTDEYSEKHKGKGAKSFPTETQLQGMLGEISHQVTLESEGVKHTDGNSIAMNMPGVDTVMSGCDKFLGQSKLHLCATDTTPYLGHVERRTEYASKFVKPLIKDTESSKKIRSGLEKFAKESKNKELKEIVSEAKTQVGEGVSVEDLISDMDDKGLVNRVANAMCFPVPCDTFDQLPTDKQEHFTPLLYDTRALNKVKAQFEFRPVQERVKKTEEDKDGNYEF